MDINFALRPVPGGTLRAGCAAYALGAAWQAFGGTQLGSFLLMDWGWHHSWVNALERGLAIALLGQSICLVFCPNRILLLLLSAYAGIQAWITTMSGGEPFSDWAFGAQALRICAPLGLAIFLDGKVDTSRIRFATVLLVMATASTFSIHGLEAALTHPRFIDYLITASRGIFGINLSQDDAQYLLKAIGAMDLAGAFFLVMRPVPWIAGWLAIWGVVTACARPLEIGIYGTMEILLRASHFSVPAALAVHWSCRKHFSPPSVMPICILPRR